MTVCPNGHFGVEIVSQKYENDHIRYDAVPKWTFWSLKIKEKVQFDQYSAEARLFC